MNKETIKAAANEYADYNVFQFNGNLFSNNNDEAGNAYKCSTESFKAGARWQEQQSANEAVEFADWLLGNNWQNTGIRWYKIHSAKSNINNTSENCYKTSQQLYELWLQTKTQ